MSAETSEAGAGLGALDPDNLVAELDEAMGALLALLDAETRLVRASKLKEAARLQEDKGRLAQRYMQAIARLKENGEELTRLMPDRLDRLRKRHDAFREKLRLNMAVLATAKSVSENLVRSVASEMAAGDRAQTYGAGAQQGTAATPLARPVTLNRSL